MSSTAEYLRRSGMTNQQVGMKSGDICSPIYTFTGICKQTSCSFYTYNKRINDCPKCGYALFWDKKRSDDGA